MRHRTSNALLGTLVLAALAAALMTRQIAFGVVGAMAGSLLGFSVAGLTRPLPRAILALKGQPVTLHIWGAVPPAAGRITVESVNVLGAGLHVFFQRRGAPSMHLKVAQPRHVRVGPQGIVVGAARYVQWEGTRVPFADGTPAVSLTPLGSTRQGPESVA